MKKILFIVFISILVMGCSAQSTPDVKLTGNTKKITMTAKQWEFLPPAIEVNHGDTVELTIKSIDVTHGILIPEFGINERLEPQKEVVINFIADKKGEFDFFCSTPCGRGHRDMRGLLIVN